MCPKSVDVVMNNFMKMRILRITSSVLNIVSEPHERVRW